jgi:hypothetical protein
MPKAYMRSFKILAVLAAFLFAQGANAVDVGPCQAGSIMICNMQIPMPANPVGYKAVMTVPPPYVHDPFTVECLGSVNGSSGYEVSDLSKVSCKVETCPAYSVNVCGYDIPTPGGTVEGEKVQLTIPPTFVTQASASRHPTVNAVCADVNGQPRYYVKDHTGSACIDFACPPTDIAICDTFINISEYSENGGTKTITMPAPFQPDKFTVQCLARNDKNPAYEIIEQKNVSCKKRE